MGNEIAGLHKHDDEDEMASVEDRTVVQPSENVPGQVLATRHTARRHVFLHAM